VFIVYTDTTWPPLTERIKNPKRFSILLAPITRSYSYTTDKSYSPKTLPYERNNLQYPESLDEYFAYFAEWQKIWSGNAFSYEYHFWHHQYKDHACINFSKRINEDVKEYQRRGVNGIVEDGSQRSFFPTGLQFYTYARTLYDTSLSAEEIAKDYFAYAFGEGAEEFYNYLSKISDAFRFDYITGEGSSDMSVSSFYCPEYADSLAAVIPSILKEGRSLVKKYYNFEERVRTVSVRLIEKHILFTDYYARAIIEKARGNDKASAEIFTEWRDTFGRLEYELRRYFDHFLFFRKAEGAFALSVSKPKNATEL